jgi:hypothetical protein
MSAPKNGTYYVTTWDTLKQMWTPQPGVRTGPWSLWGLRRAIRALRELGYSANKGDPSVSIVRTDK